MRTPFRWLFGLGFRSEFFGRGFGLRGIRQRLGRLLGSGVLLEKVEG